MGWGQVKKTWNHILNEQGEGVAAFTTPPPQHIIFTNDKYISFQNITIFSCKADFNFFAVPQTIVFKISFRSNFSSRPARVPARRVHHAWATHAHFSQYLFLETPPPIPIQSQFHAECPILAFRRPPFSRSS